MNASPNKPETQLPDLIDSHCHLNYDFAPKSLDHLVNEAHAAGVKTLICIGTDSPGIAQVQKIAEQYPQIFFTAGIHPHEAKTLQAEDWNVIKSASKHQKCVAIGEIGLDYHYDHSPRDLQIEQLHAQLQWASEIGKPVVIHSREAEDDLLKLLRDYCSTLQDGKLPGVIHCFSSEASFGKACIDLGFYISFSGILTFKKTESLRDFARQVPLDQIMVETDSPYLAPVPHRGKKCEPSMVTHTNALLAQLRGKSAHEMASITSNNTRRLFALPQSSDL